jgi:acyl-CoA synthetase (AMP-forming)/AMP-acid ligase II
MPASPPDDLFNIMYTSGTTGLPKGIMHSHRIRAHYALLLGPAWRMTTESLVLHTGAIVFNGAFVTLMPAFHLGATYILQRQFEAAAMIETIAREKVTHIMVVPAQIIALLDSPAFDPGETRIAADDPFTGRAAGPGAQGPAQHPAARSLPRTLRPYRGLPHHPRQDRGRAQGRLGRLPAGIQRRAHRR